MIFQHRSHFVEILAFCSPCQENGRDSLLRRSASSDPERGGCFALDTHIQRNGWKRCHYFNLGFNWIKYSDVLKLEGIKGQVTSIAQDGQTDPCHISRTGTDAVGLVPAFRSLIVRNHCFTGIFFSHLALLFSLQKDVHNGVNYFIMSCFLFVWTVRSIIGFSSRMKKVFQLQDLPESTGITTFNNRNRSVESLRHTSKCSNTDCLRNV